MRSAWRTGFLALLWLGCSAVEEYDLEAGTTFLPANDLDREDGMFRSDLSEEEFQAMIDRAHDAFAPLIAERGATLEINGYWTKSTVNAEAKRSGSKWIVNLYGGLARRREMTRDAFQLAICHEIAHHLAGFPPTTNWMNKWASCEGQADYFAAHSCARLLWLDDLVKNAEIGDTIEPPGRALCDAVHQEESDRKLCYRVLLGGKSIGEWFAGVGKVAFDTPDKKVVKSTDRGHPSGQCRMDTFTAGALCLKAADLHLTPMTEAESARQVCTESDQAGVGARPRCWFKPTI